MDVNGRAGVTTEAGGKAASGPDITLWADLTEKLQEVFLVGEILRDDAGAAVDWRYVALNAAWEAVHGQPRANAIGRTMRAFNPGAGLEWVETFATVVETGQPATFAGTLRGRWYEGRAYHLEDQRFMALFTESTARRRAADQASRLTALVEQSTDLIGIADAAENVLFLNPAGLAMVGLPDMQAATAIKVRDYFIYEERDITPATAFAAAVKHGGWEGEARLRHFVTGETIPVLHSVFPLRDATGAVTAVGTVTRDLRARLRSEARRSALLELGDRLRNMVDTDEMSLVAAGILLRGLNASRAAYGTVDAAPETVVISRDCTADGVSSIAGSYRFRDFGSYIDDLKRDELVAFADTETDPRAAAEAWRVVGARAAINLPIFEHGRFVAVVLVHQTTPRPWSPEEIAFVRNVADRTRSAIERRRAEQQLQELAASLEREVAQRTADRNLLWRLSTDIMAVTDFLGVVLSVNPAWSAVLGWSEADLMGRSLVELIHPEDVEPSTRAVMRMSHGEPVRRFENRYRHRDGSYRWISWTAVPGAGVISAVGRDVTDERARAEALELSETRLRSVFETSYLYQGLLTPEGIVLDANKASLAGIQARLQDVVGKPFWQTAWFSGTPGLPALIEAAIPVVAAGQPVRRELTADLPTGRRVFDMSLHPVRNATGAVIAILPEAADVTEQRDAEAQLRQAQKMEAVGQLTGGLAHDFNNLMTGIGGNLELLQARVRQGDTAELERFIESAMGAARRAAALTHRLLAFSRQQTLDPRPTDVSRLVAGMEEMIRRTMGPDVEVEVVDATGLWRTMVDQHQLENALLNLCINARQAMPRGGKLTIETCNKVLDDHAARERELQPGPYVTLCVSDTGTGMSPDVMARAFDPFFTTKPIGEGTGLGLSMIYGFVRQSGGQARIYSEPGQGALVCLYLPRTTAADEDTELPNQTAPPPQGGRGETVLVVDDEPTIRMLVTEVLQDLGYETIDAADGPSGLEILRSGRPVDLLISDVGLPGGMNGRELAGAAQAVRPGLLVLFITGYAEHAVLSHGHLKPGMHVLTKPFNIEALARRVREIVGPAREVGE
jgi:PAS domain S-box-containing protein